MIYADYNGTSHLLPEVKNYLIDRLSTGPFANPNSIHGQGQQVNRALNECRTICAQMLGTGPDNIIFNSGASEGISQVFHWCLGDQKEKKRFAISAIEHSAVVSNADYYVNQGCTLDILPVTSDGVLDMAFFENYIKTNHRELALISVMAANNETGVIQPITEIARLCQKYDVKFFSDTTQYCGKTAFNFNESGLDYAVLSGHKVGALVGSGILMAKNIRSNFTPIIFGGGQERGMRGGTQNYIATETLAVAMQNLPMMVEYGEKLKKYRIEFERQLKEKLPSVVIMGEKVSRLPNTSMIAFAGIHGQAIQIELESENIFVSTSSACSDNEPHMSKVLKAMGIPDHIGRGAIRISLCHSASEKTYQNILHSLVKALQKLAKIQSF